ncbi:MAG: hypothetical protein H6741_05800 [Alphaproteobacteria bacterium]|nr:hypothetical protein [Alphaproteobacteria bacterium]MCB9792221.1 hypothetical protein [Alphaproteobacteria bacterium]
MSPASSHLGPAPRAALAAALGWWLLHAPAWAQDDPFAVLDDPAAGGASAPADPAVTTTSPPAAVCDDIAAAAAAGDFNIFIAAVVGVAALLGVAIWYGLERKAVSSWGVRWLIAVLLAGVAAGALVFANPFASEAALRMMNEAACQHHFLLASAGAVGQGLVLGFLPATAVTFLLLVIARKIL